MSFFVIIVVTPVHQVLREEEGGEAMAQWYRLLGLKNRLVRREQELMVGSKQLELEDRAEGLEEQLGRGLGQAEEQVGGEGERKEEEGVQWKKEREW